MAIRWTGRAHPELSKCGVIECQLRIAALQLPRCRLSWNPVQSLHDIGGMGWVVALQFSEQDT